MMKPKDGKPKGDQNAIKLGLDANKPEGNRKSLGGGNADEWNDRLSNLTLNALPMAHSKNNDTIAKACLAVSYGVMDMAPADPVEGILIAQLMAANEAALAMYQKGWGQPPEFFEARTKYLQLADKATRTVVMLTERLDHHRGRGQQQITVKHVTTNNVTADQAIIADSVTTGGGARNVASPALLAASPEMSMPVLSETRVPDLVGVGGGTKSK
ncbi:MAG: hypothetical protein ACXWKP_12810 [Bradyrhizobium sp.]